VLNMQFARHATPTTTAAAPAVAVGDKSVRRGPPQAPAPAAGAAQPLRGYAFAPKDGSVNYAACDGIYKPATEDGNSEMNGKPYYLNREKGRFLAWNGRVWEITATHYLPELRQHHKEHGFYPGTFGGFHSGTGDTPLGDWKAYAVTALTAQVLPAAYRVAPGPWGVLGAASSPPGPAKLAGSGLYVATGGSKDGKPVFYDGKSKLLAVDGARWSITEGGKPVLTGGGAWPDEGVAWPAGAEVAEVLKPKPGAQTTEPKEPPERSVDAEPDSDTQRHHRSFQLALKPGAVNSGNCDGTYTLGEGAETRIEGKPFYLNKEKQRLLAATGSEWQIVALGALPQLLKQSQTGAKGTVAARVFHKGGSAAAPDEGAWESYTVTGDSPKAFLFTARPEGNNYANCDGLYNAADGEDAEINGKPYFVNSEKERFLAWNGRTWEVTAMYFLPSVLKHHRAHGFWPGAFGGYHAGGGDWPADGPWDDYVVKGDEPVVVDRRRAFHFTSRPGADNYGDCDGVYKVAPGADAEINGKPYYVHVDRPRFLAWNGNTWEITASEYLPGIQQHLINHGFWPGTFGGYHYGGENRPDDGAWQDYTVVAAAPSAYVFTPKPGSANYANCGGRYEAVKGEDTDINGKPYYVNTAGRRFLAWTGVVWEITATDYLSSVKQHHATHGFWPGSFGGYHSGGGELPDEGKWADYAVQAQYS